MPQQNITQNNPPPIEDDEIDLLSIAKTLWSGRKTVIITILIFMAIGLFMAIFSPKEYTASTTIVPATQGKNVGGSLGGLAAMAGIDLGGMSSESGIPPSLYPQITGSIPFQLELLKTPLNFEGHKTPITYENYYTKYNSPGLLATFKKYTVGLPGVIISAIKGKPAPITTLSSPTPAITIISNEELGLINQLSSQLSLDINTKDGYVTISVNMPEAIAAAEMAQKAQELLQQYIIDFKVQKSSEQLRFIKGRYAEKEREFRSAQQQLASFQDRNQFLTSALSKTYSTRLQMDYDLAYGVYSELAKQLETQQIQVKEDTPVFTILKPVTVPIEKSKPNRPLILIIWIFLGGIVGIGMVFGRGFVLGVKEKWNK